MSAERWKDNAIHWMGHPRKVQVDELKLDHTAFGVSTEDLWGEVVGVPGALAKGQGYRDWEVINISVFINPCAFSNIKSHSFL